MRRLLRFLLLPLCLISFLAAAEEAGTPPPHVVMAQRLLSNLPNIPNAIQEGMEGKHGEIRKMVSNVLGDGLISQLVVNPMSLASQFGIDLDQFGINKTLTEQVLGTGAESNVKKQAVPNTLSTGEQGEKIWSSDKGFKKDKQTNEESEKEPLYVNGHLVNEEEFRESLDNEMRIRPNRPALVQEKPTETSTTTTSTLPTTTTKNPQEKMAEKVLNALGKSLFSSDYTSTPSAPVIPSVTAGNDQIVVEPEYKWDSVDPRRLAEVSNLLRRAPPQPAMPPAMPPSSFGGLTQEADLPSSTADSVFSYFKNRELSSLTPEEVHTLQSYLQTYEQNLQTKELLTKRQKLQSLQNRLNEHKRRMEEQRSREEQLRIQEFELTKEARKVQEQLRKQLDKWHNSFNPNSDEPSSPLNDFSSDSMTLKTSIEQAIPPVTEQPAIKSPGRSVSGLQNQLRYSPEIRRKPQKQPLFNESEFTSNCECVEVDFERMKGVWMQSLAAPLALDMQYRSVGRVFGTDDSIPLNCSSISLGRPQQSEAAQDARITWTFRTENSRKLFRLSGTVLTMDHRTIRVQFNDYNGGKTHFPVCALKTSYTSDGPYDYIVLVEANTCKSASLLVRDPETFFDNDNTELIHFLQHKVRSNELDEMDVVPHEGVCSDE
ncbi:hypothetical protein QR680_001877 [Steinernema hermaphroditum]|uniref:Uncharacterized protein n=1 Tax=Steinernema hermaphroditum TaxID=289476 RepID=A0AA39LH03_9BILA|nr:hypothetical protein QR680_001877 [Steinernema hermaphroditum]